MDESPVEIAGRLLRGSPGELEVLRIHQFRDDEAAHDDHLQQEMLDSFEADFDRIRIQFAEVYGLPNRIGEDGDGVIPLSGVFRFACWSVEHRELFVASAHEDRECPLLLVLGIL